ncbi:hypothetical protein [Bradyrhizobium sp. CCBAU 25360]
MNNSTQPNTYQHHHRRLLTARHVQPGEELTYDCFSVRRVTYRGIKNHP